MLRTNIFLSFFLHVFLHFVNPLHAQFFDQNPVVLEKGSYLVTYSLLWKEDTLNRDFQKQEDMYLLIGSKFSQFISKNYLTSELEGRRMEKEGKLQLFLSNPNSGHITRFVYQIYKDFENDKITYFGHVVPTRFKYEENISDIIWKLGADTSRVLGYTVYQAFTNYGGRKWIVWYATEIPINDGPYKFSGLPGLILKAYDSKKDYIFEAVKTEKLKDKMDIEMSTKNSVSTTRYDFLKAENNLRYDIINRLKESGAGTDVQQSFAKSMLRQNNPIELK